MGQAGVPCNCYFQINKHLFYPVDKSYCENTQEQERDQYQSMLNGVRVIGDLLFINSWSEVL